MYTKRTDHLRPEGAYQVLALAQRMEAEGHSIIHFEAGQPDFDTFANISLAGVRAITEGHTRYTPPAGMIRIKEAIADHAGKQRNILFRPEQVVVSPGAKPNLFFPTLALVEPGDEVIYPDPGFPTYEAMIRFAGGVPIPIPLREENGFTFDLQTFDQAIGDRTKMVILNSPGNPTGGVIPFADLQHVARAVQQYNAWVLSDEIYACIVYDNLQSPSIAQVEGMLERTIIVDGFSKTYNMTGWRLGFGIMPEGLAERVQLLLTHSIGCSAHFTQLAALEALTGPQEQVQQVVQEYQRRRDVIVEGLNAIPGIVCQTPQGAFYVFPNITGLGRSSDEMAALLLKEAGVALLPGNAFGLQGEGYLRLSYANSMDNILHGLERIRATVERL